MKPKHSHPYDEVSLSNALRAKETVLKLVYTMCPAGTFGWERSSSVFFPRDPICRLEDAGKKERRHVRGCDRSVSRVFPHAEMPRELSDGRTKNCF